MNVYQSKIDSGVILILSMGLLIPGMVFIAKGAWPGLLIILLVAIFIAYLMRQTKYTITDTTLVVRSGFLVHIKIAISDIVSVSKTDSILSAPANSITDRIEIKYQGKKSVIISPKERDAFLNQLLKINPNIQVVL
ncbi:PH domain-containing protein [Flavobacterium sp. CAU 1735]|uniref:PH domain-containing protein n=1 Tax=Flavobacterium sp. CAU 1735 TaxID=3140361 RepID=UPI003261CE83